MGYMKALKTKTLKISEVLLSISRLFSGPERLPLLKRYVIQQVSFLVMKHCPCSHLSSSSLDSVLLLRVLDFSLRLVAILISFLPCIIVLHRQSHYMLTANHSFPSLRLPLKLITFMHD